ncbi:MAG: ADOP family duplicated permease, partial [Vicinamibacteria bacterium]
NRLGSKDSALGSTLRVDGSDYVLIGVLGGKLGPPFNGNDLFITHSWEPPSIAPAGVRAGSTYLQVTARLKPGVTLEAANQELAVLSARYKSSFASNLDSQTNSDTRTLSEEMAGSLRPTFRLLLGAVAAVLLIACANVSNLFLVSLSSRSKEVALRLALGAERRDLLRQFMLESLLFAALATALGGLVGHAAMKGIEHAAVNQLPPNTVFEFNRLTFAFMSIVCVLSALMVGLVPALQASRIGLADVLKDAARGAPGGTRGTKVRSTLIVAQVAMSVTLLVGSSLLLLSLYRLQSTPAGLRTDGVATAFVGISTERYKTPPEQAEFYRQVVERLRSIPQVKNASVAFGLPLTGSPIAPYTVFGNPVLPLSERPLANINIVDADFFNTLRIPLRKGRFFDANDRSDTPKVCIINESFAARLFPNQSALGHSLLRGPNAETHLEIVGVVADVKSNGLGVPAPDSLYSAFPQMGRPGANILARVDGDPTVLQPMFRAAVALVDHNQPISFFQTMDTVLQQSVGFQQLMAGLVAIFAAVALVLTAIGLYSVIAYSVSQRTSEIGIRMALGAQAGQIVSHVLSGGMRLVALGLALGLVGAAGAAELMSSLLFSVAPIQLGLYAGVTILFTGIAALACLLPARRASRIDPLQALRCD